MPFRILLPVLAAAAILMALAGAVATAGAADTHAPKGARLDWLPTDAWVMSAWLPFDEDRLDVVVKTDRDELGTWLDDHRTLLQLARAHHVAGTTAQIAHALVAPRLAQVKPALRPALQRRAETMLTQAHLSRHVLFHVFHTPAIPDNARGVFGLSPARFRALRDSGMSPLKIGARGGKSAKHVQGALWTLLVKRAQRGVALGAMSRSEARHLLAEQKAQLPFYVGRAFRTPEQQVAFICRPH